MKTLTLPIYNTQGQEVDTVKLDATVFDGSIHTPSIHQTVNAFRAAQRGGHASTKTRGEVSGGGRKPWRQKGTGRARVGSIRSPLWRHGGVVFGPHPRDFLFEVPKKIKALALKSCLNAKVNENSLIVMDNFALGSAKTKDAATVLRNLKLNTKEKLNKSLTVLLLLDKIESNQELALRNIEAVDLMLARDVNTYEVISHRKVVVTKKGLEEICARLKKTIKPSASRGAKKDS